MGAPALLPRSRARPREKVRRLAVLPRTRLGAAGLSPQQPPAAVQEQPETEAGRELRRRPRSAAARVAGPGSRPVRAAGNPGFRDAAIYPLERPNVRKARALARGHLRKRTVVLYAIDAPSARVRAHIPWAISRRSGSRSTSRHSHPPRTSLRSKSQGRLRHRGFDWLLITSILTSTRICSSTVAITEVAASRASTLPLQQADAARSALRGQARYQAYADLDLRLSRDAAPFLIIGYGSDVTFVSNRVGVGCLDLSPYLDLAAVCLK